MSVEFTPRYPGHEPPSNASELIRLMESRLSVAPVTRAATPPVAPPPPDPKPRTPRSQQVEYRRVARPAVKRVPRTRVYVKRKNTQQKWRRVMASRTQVRCKRCGFVREVTEAEQDALCPQAKPGGQTRPITHGTRTGYFRGCRCAECKTAESTDRKRRYREANPVKPKVEVYRPAPVDCQHPLWWRYRRRLRKDGTLAVRVQCRSCGVTRTCDSDAAADALCSGKPVSPDAIPQAHPDHGRPRRSTVHASHAMYRRGCRCKECVEFTNRKRRDLYAAKMGRPIRPMRRAV